MVGEEDRLRPLEMSISRHMQTEILSGKVEEYSLELLNQCADFSRFCLSRQPEVERHLVVP